MNRLTSFRARLLILFLLAVLPSLALALYMNFDQRRLETARVRDEIIATARLSAANEQNFIAHTRQLLATLTQFTFLTLTTNEPFAHEHLSNLRKLAPDYLNFGLIESNGLLFCSSEPFTNAVNLGDRAYFRRAVQSRSFSAGDFQVGRLTGQLGLNFGMPVLNERGGVQRVLFASLRVSLFSEALARIPLPAEGAIFVLDRSGTVVARSPAPKSWIG